jgi:hypothetical protein
LCFDDFLKDEVMKRAVFLNGVNTSFSLLSAPASNVRRALSGTLFDSEAFMEVASLSEHAPLARDFSDVRKAVKSVVSIVMAKQGSVDLSSLVDNRGCEVAIFSSDVISEYLKSVLSFLAAKKQSDNLGVDESISIPDHILQLMDDASDTEILSCFDQFRQQLEGVDSSRVAVEVYKHFLVVLLRRTNRLFLIKLIQHFFIVHSNSPDLSGGLVVPCLDAEQRLFSDSLNHLNLQAIKQSTATDQEQVSELSLVTKLEKYLDALGEFDELHLSSKRCLSSKIVDLIQRSDVEQRRSFLQLLHYHMLVQLIKGKSLLSHLSFLKELVTKVEDQGLQRGVLGIIIHFQKRGGGFQGLGDVIKSCQSA